MTPEQERAAIVAWLLNEAEAARLARDAASVPCVAEFLDASYIVKSLLAGAIERNEHHKGSST